MKFTIEVVSVRPSVYAVPASDPVSSVPIIQSLEHVPEQEVIVYRQPVKGIDNDNTAGNWAYGSSELIAFGSGEEISL